MDGRLSDHLGANILHRQNDISNNLITRFTYMNISRIIISTYKIIFCLCDRRTKDCNLTINPINLQATVLVTCLQNKVCILIRTRNTSNFRCLSSWLFRCTHYNDVTCASRRLNPSQTQLFAYQFVQANNQVTSKLRTTGPFARGIHRWPVDSPHKRASKADSVYMSSYLHAQWLLCHVNTLRPRQDGRHFPDDIFQMHFLEWKFINFDWGFHWSLFPRVQLTIFHHRFR